MEKKLLTNGNIIYRNADKRLGGVVWLMDESGERDGTIRQLTPREVADLLGHTTSEIMERYYVKRDLSRLNGITDGFEM